MILERTFIILKTHFSEAIDQEISPPVATVVFEEHDKQIDDLDQDEDNLDSMIFVLFMLSRWLSIMNIS